MEESCSHHLSADAYYPGIKKCAGEYLQPAYTIKEERQTSPKSPLTQLPSELNTQNS